MSYENIGGEINPEVRIAVVDKIRTELRQLRDSGQDNKESIKKVIGLTAKEFSLPLNQMKLILSRESNKKPMIDEIDEEEFWKNLQEETAGVIDNEYNKSRSFADRQDNLTSQTEDHNQTIDQEADVVLQKRKIKYAQQKRLLDKLVRRGVVLQSDLRKRLKENNNILSFIGGLFNRRKKQEQQNVIDNIRQELATNNSQVNNTKSVIDDLQQEIKILSPSEKATRDQSLVKDRVATRYVKNTLGFGTAKEEEQKVWNPPPLDGEASSRKAHRDRFRQEQAQANQSNNLDSTSSADVDDDILVSTNGIEEDTPEKRKAA